MESLISKSIMGTVTLLVHLVWVPPLLSARDVKGSLPSIIAQKPVKDALISFIGLEIYVLHAQQGVGPAN